MTSDISVYRIILGIIAAFFLVQRAVRFAKKEKNQSFFKLLTTLVVWGSIFIFAFFPDLARTISRQLGLGENLNTLIFSGFVFVFLIIFKLLDHMEKMERNISEMVRKEALRELNNLKNN